MLSKTLLIAALLALALPSQAADLGGGVSDDDYKAASDAIFWQLHDGKPETFRIICANPRHQDDADLCQQWISAQSANEMIDLSRKQVWLGFFSTLGLLITIGLTILSLQQSQLALRLNIETTRHELRAYIEAKIAFIWFDPEFNDLHLQYVIANHGQTPARHLKFRGYAYPSAKNVSRSFSEVEREPPAYSIVHDVEVKNSVFPGSPVNFDGVMLIRQYVPEMTSFITKGDNLYFNYIIDYRDFTGSAQMFEIQAFISGTGTPINHNGKVMYQHVPIMDIGHGIAT